MIVGLSWLVVPETTCNNAESSLPGNQGSTSYKHAFVAASHALSTPHLGLPILLKDGNLLHEAIGGEHCVKRFDIHRIRSILNLRRQTSSQR